MVSSLVKIPCILAATVGLNVVWTAPNPPPTSEERVASVKLESLMARSFLPTVTRGAFWGAGLAEVAVILASYAPSSPISQIALKSLIFPGGSPERIRVSPPFFAGSFAAVLSGWIRYRCYKTMGHLYTFEMSIRKNHNLVTSGPYSVVRHPGYTGAVLSVVGLVLLHGAKGSWLRESGALDIKFLKRFTLAYVALHSIIVFGLLQRMLVEDKAMHQLYGEEWEDWARRVPSRLIPWLF